MVRSRPDLNVNERDDTGEAVIHHVIERNIPGAISCLLEVDSLDVNLVTVRGKAESIFSKVGMHSYTLYVVVQNVIHTTISAGVTRRWVWLSG